MKIKKQHLILIGVCLLAILAMIIYRIFFYDGTSKKSSVTTGQVAKSISLIKHSVEECNKSENRFDGKEKDKWYAKYMNTMYADGFFDEDDIPATERSASGAFTYGKFEKLLDNMNIDDKTLNKYVKDNRKSKKITTDEWSEIYDRIVSLYSGNKVEKKTMTIVATISNVPELKSWETVTTDGTYRFEGVGLDYYIDNEIEAFVRDNEIVWVNKRVSKEVTYKNVWIVNSSTSQVNVFMYGINRNILVEGAGSDFINSVADINIKGNKVTSMNIKKDTITGKVLSSDYDFIEIEGYGKVPLDDDYKVYKVYGNLEEKSVRDILVGYDSQIFMVADGKICAAVIDRDINAKNIRVLISNKTYDSIFHDGVILSSTGGMTITYGDKKIVTDPGEKVYIDPSSGILSEGRAKFESNDIKGTITVSSIKRSYGEPSYRGSIEVATNESGLLVVNELSLEEYLYGVVPSEMPSGYPEEALKTQAVCARTYAYKHLLGNSYNKYGAHVDDTTAFQVYNNIAEQETTNKAVNDTYGQILTYEGEPIMAYYYSTSCGSTSDGSIWGSDLPYIKSVLLSKDGKSLDLSDEKVFTAFIKGDYDTFESDCAWFRWNVDFDLNELTKVINEKIESIYKTNKNNVLTLVNGEYVKKDISTIGVLKRIQIDKRGESGVVESIIFEGTEATVKVFYQSNIRKLLNPKGMTINRNNSKSIDSLTMLPSGYFTIEEIKEDGVLSGYRFYGGGYGHGAGMSQNGAKGMAEELYKYDDILKKFYAGVELSGIYALDMEDN